MYAGQSTEVVREVRREQRIPGNLVMRASGAMIDGKPPRGFRNTSSVVTHHARPGSFACPAPQQGNQCGPCRACWQRDVADVSYPLH
jgi:hypothetical protein